MTEKKKNILIIFLALTSIILFIFLMLSTTENNNSQDITSENNLEQIESLKEDLLEYQNDNDTSSIEKENVCTNFLKKYYSVQHSKSKSASLPECKSYLTEQLYNKLLPDEESTEYPNDVVDIDYTSSISINNTYINNADPNKLIIRCTIKRTINDMQSVNEYFVSLTVESINDEWLINSFEVISIQGE